MKNQITRGAQHAGHIPGTRKGTREQEKEANGKAKKLFFPQQAAV